MCNLALSTAARNSDGPCGTHRSRLPHRRCAVALDIEHAEEAAS
jgi:hypothetical protein